jgi:putative copper export protein
MALVFHRQLSEFRDPFASLAEDASLLLTGTAWGRTWMIAAGASLALAITMTVGRVGVAPGVAWLVATPLIVGLAAYPAVSGHAAGTEGLRWLTMPADTLHVLAAGAWVGGLAFVLVAEHRWRRGAAPGSVLPVLVPVFSPVAIVSVVLLVATGTLASWIHLDGLSALTTTDYGRLLLAKVVVGLGVGVVGVVNWRLITPRLETPDGPRALRRSALLELVFAQVVLVLTAILVRTSPLGH